jgi:NADPH:quinone reductase-like Zn-dependent oxidoreductase
MKAAVCSRFGPPEVLQLRDVPAPVPASGDVLIRVRAADVNPSDCYGRSGMAGAPLWMRLVVRTLFRVFSRSRILGIVLAGDVEQCGTRVTQLRKGDRVFAFTGMRAGSHAEYACVRAKGIIAPMPDNVGYAEAAAISYGGLIASACLRRIRIRPGDSVVIYGASGAIGSAAVQLAVQMGASVTGVSSAANASLVRSLGAHATLAYDSDDQPGSARSFQAGSSSPSTPWVSGFAATTSSPWQSCSRMAGSSRSSIECIRSMKSSRLIGTSRRDTNVAAWS